MANLLIVGAGGFLGAMARYSLSAWTRRAFGESFPLGTLLVNVLGCLVMGVMVALVVERPVLSPQARLFVMVGILGSFTTFSTFGQETLSLLQEAETGRAILSVGLNLLLGVVAVWVGRTLTMLVST